MRLLTIILIILLVVYPSYAAKYAGEPFALGVGARPLALGGAAVAGPFDGSAAYWNPAGLNYLSGRNLMAMHAETFGSLLNQDFIGYTYNRNDTGYTIRAYGFYLYYLGGGGIKITDYDVTQQRPVVIREESHGDYLLAASLSGKVLSNIDAGVTVRIIYRDLATISGFGLTADIGALYKPYDFARLGLMVTDITSGFIRYSGGNTESVAPTVKPGLMLIRKYRDFTGRFVASGDIKFEGIKTAAQYWVGEISLDTHFGGEISYKEMIFGRLGFDIGNFTAGVGLDVRRITIDLAYLHNSYLDETFRVSGGYRF